MRSNRPPRSRSCPGVRRQSFTLVFVSAPASPGPILVRGLSALLTSRLPTAFAESEPPDGWALPRTFPRPEALERAVDVLPGVGPAVKQKLARLGLRTVGDLLAHRPFRYEEPVPERRMADLRADEEVAIAGEVLSVSKRRRGRLQMLTARVTDGSATVSATWFNQPWLERQLQTGTPVRLRGRQGRYGFDVRSFDIGAGEATADFAPVYPASEEITAKKLRELVGAALPRAFADPLPAELKERERLPQRADALWALHRPRSLQEAETGRRRLAFDELLFLQIGIARRRREREGEIAPALGEPGEVLTRYREVLPFRLTIHQERAIGEIDHDLARTVPMQRLLQGDVGSGKTVVALYALLRAVEAGRQGALMAPTETLAEQHFLTLEEPCRALGVTCALLTSSSPKRERDLAPTADVVVGTHALIQEGVQLRDLAVAVVDEQHRFGVAQRRALAETSGAMGINGTRAKPAPLSSGSASAAAGVEQRKALAEGRAPHVLHMTATPIPRTLALTVYGDLAVSEIAKPPANRKLIKTAWVAENRMGEAYSRLRKHLDAGWQAYVVCPLIEESETSQARAAEVEAERLQHAELKGYRVGLLHGRLPPAERRELMARFKAHDLDVLVATTVIEVGVDVPNATIMIVQEADRFGLAQLHQLRGRVGRGAEQSYCLLISRAREDLTESAVARLEALVRTTDGFELAEVDLDIRGGGQLLGTRQSGLTDLRFARLREDRDLLERARNVAEEVVETPGPLADEVERITLAALTA
ncbi:MAG: ATP-dependent DNA helicase RecG [Actinobacteria bacterium]|nr:MAG: ATP-dependent DNA helicase RecG [Actinomycetota bacterium]